mmetsp:Transcript_6086/g.13617  ORF Transcript_6086/g.13617 Transcript_6086/m.13617 type:complete len:99 (+) Transcript_6086:867-1163(+)
MLPHEKKRSLHILYARPSKSVEQSSKAVTTRRSPPSPPLLTIIAVKLRSMHEEEESSHLTLSGSKFNDDILRPRGTKSIRTQTIGRHQRGTVTSRPQR